MKDLHAYYLEQMGIQNWIIRQSNNCISSLEQLGASVAACIRCPLHETRTKTVFARGNPRAQLMIVGEAPGFHEDKQGLPFVGKAGHLLNKMLVSIGLSEEEVYIANVLKCRPPNNRDPKADEIARCSHYLEQQINLIDPSLILAVGRFAGQFLLKEPLPLNKMRGQFSSYNGKPVLVSYHPAYLLRNPKDKKKAYDDLLLAKKWLTERHGQG